MLNARKSSLAGLQFDKYMLCFGHLDDFVHSDIANPKIGIKATNKNINQTHMAFSNHTHTPDIQCTQSRHSNPALIDLQTEQMITRIARTEKNCSL